jgi:ATP-dependent DNA helicase RecQ
LTPASIPETEIADADERGAREARVLELIRRTFGFSTLRPMQGQAIRAALDGRDSLVVLPTGGGKSLCYQAPALMREGLTVVVSPLISLMQDQIDALREYGVPAAMLNSAQTSSERREVESDLDRGSLKLLFVAPERLMLDGFLSRLERFGLSAIAVDEAHCISHWGHDFRPEYRMLGELRRSMPRMPIQAYTATATPRVRDDIVSALGLSDPVLLVGDFDRPNLTYRVQPRRDLVAQVMSVIERHPREAGIVYCLRRTDVEELCADLKQRSVRCAAYHAGLAPEERKRAQFAFQSEEIDVVVATVAFGMGIDRSDVRFVVHASLPKGVEQYSQETGRAGRDGLPAECVLFYGGGDYHGWKMLVERSAREAHAQGVEGALDDLDNALERISHVWNFATSATCRHRALWSYFGQSDRESRHDAAAVSSPQESAGARAAESSDAACDAEHPVRPNPPRAMNSGTGCNACDVCLGEVARVADSQVLAQKILSCVVRCGQRYGAAHVTDVLRGANTEKMRQTGHDRLSTYALMKEHSAREIRAWIEQLTGQGHLRVAEGEYPTLYLSRSGVEVMRAERPVILFVPVAPSTRKSRGASTARAAVEQETGGDSLPAPDEQLFDHLRRFRRELAAERGVPPYVIFNDRSLLAMAARKPANAEELRAIPGVGDKKALDLGPMFLAAIADFRPTPD